MMNLTLLREIPRDLAGNVLPSVLVTITDSATGDPAVIYTDEAGNYPLSGNTILTGADGALECFLKPGRYRLVGTKAGQIVFNIAPVFPQMDGAASIWNDFQPSQWPGIVGSLGNGPVSIDVTRTGGYGAYGLTLTQYLVTAAMRSGEFDSAATHWITATNMTSSTSGLYGAWIGGNTPGGYMGHTYAGGTVIGAEFNVGNRWGNFGLQLDVGGTRATVGVQVVPDVLPAKDGINSTEVSVSVATPAVVSLDAHGFSANMGVVFRGDGTLPTGLSKGVAYFVSATGLTADEFQVSATIGGASIATTGSFAAPITVTPSYPGSFGMMLGASIWGHQWWVGQLVRYDTIAAGGHISVLNGGSVASSAPGSVSKISGHFTRGFDLSSATFAANQQAILFGSGHIVSWGGSTMSGTATTWGVSTGAGSGEGGLYANNFAQLALRWSASGGNPRLGFFGAAVSDKPTITGAKGSNAALGSLLTALQTLGLITDSSTT